MFDSSGSLPADARFAPDLEKLTPQEMEVLDQLAKGFRYKEIVDNPGISSGTLHSYICNVYNKLCSPPHRGRGDVSESLKRHSLNWKTSAREQISHPREEKVAQVSYEMVAHAVLSC